jgi:hypothetical protein
VGVPVHVNVTPKREVILTINWCLHQNASNFGSTERGSKSSFRLLKVSLIGVLLSVAVGKGFQKSDGAASRGAFLLSASRPATNISRHLLDGSNVSVTAGPLLKRALAHATALPPGIAPRNWKKERGIGIKITSPMV